LGEKFVFSRVQIFCSWACERCKHLRQLCPTRGPVEGFVRPSLGFGCSKIILHTDNLSILWLFKI